MEHPESLVSSLGPAGHVNRLLKQLEARPETGAHSSQRSRPPAGKLLIVDQHPIVAHFVRQALGGAGYQTESAKGGPGRVAIRDFDPDLIILTHDLKDRQPPFEQIAELWSQFEAPIMIVSQVRDEDAIVQALERGADDYVCIPLRAREFVARVDALLRRTARSLPARHIKVGPLSIDRGARAAFLHGEKLKLTNKEFDILVCLALNPGVVVSKEALLSHAWGAGFVHYVQALRVHISSLRRKARSVSACPEFIRSMSGSGYVLLDPAISTNRSVCAPSVGQS